MESQRKASVFVSVRLQVTAAFETEAFRVQISMLTQVCKGSRCPTCCARALPDERDGPEVSCPRWPLRVSVLPTLCGQLWSGKGPVEPLPAWMTSCLSSGVGAHPTAAAAQGGEPFLNGPCTFTLFV